MGRVGFVLLGLLALGGVGAAGFVWSFRAKFAPVQDRVRRFNRDVTNRRVMQRAGTAHASEAVVHHVGRVSGRAYTTPVGAVAIDGGFVIGLPYGPGTDWVRNVLAAGAAILDLDGVAHPIARPELVSQATMASVFSPAEQRVQRLFGVDQVLVLHHATTTTPSTSAVPAPG